MKFRCFLFAVPFLLTLACSSSTMVSADDDYVPEDGTSYDSKKTEHGNSENFILGEKALKAGQTEKAIMYLRKSVSQKSDDFDSRVALASALEDKYRHQVDKNPDLFRECVSQWLYVLKTVEESGVSVLKFLYKDEERDMPAKVHIKNLTGKLPKPFETQKMFLARVCRGQGTVSGSVLRASARDHKSTDADTSEDTSMDERASVRKAPSDRDD
jgi:hypothetical protein